MVVPYYLLGDKYERLHPEAAFILAKQAAEKARGLDDNLAEAHIAQGVVRELIDNDFDGAARSFQKAIELNPESSEGYREYGLLLLREGKNAEGLSKLRNALKLQPASLQIRRDLGRGYYYNKEYDKAIQELKELLEYQPDFVRAHQFLAFSYLQTGEYDKASEAFAKAIQLDKSENMVDNTSFFAEVAALSGDVKKAEALLNDLIDYVTEYNKEGAQSISLIYITLNRYDEAMEWVKKSAEAGDIPPSILVDPRWDPIRDRSDFQEVINASVH